jgi:hypothetical protein
MIVCFLFYMKYSRGRHESKRGTIKDVEGEKGEWKDKGGSQGSE